jgi:hypothetical protein
MKMKYGSIQGSIKSQAGLEPTGEEPIYKADSIIRGRDICIGVGRTWPSNHSKCIAKYKSRENEK